MRQPIRKRVAEANGIDTIRYTYTALFDMNNIMKIASVDHKMNNDGKEYGIVLTSLRLMGDILRKKYFDYSIGCYDGEGSGVLRWQLYKDYKANRDKNYENHDPNMTEYDRKLRDFAKMVMSHSRAQASDENEEESQQNYRINVEPNDINIAKFKTAHEYKSTKKGYSIMIYFGQLSKNVNR